MNDGDLCSIQVLVHPMPAASRRPVVGKSVKAGCCHPGLLLLDASGCSGLHAAGPASSRVTRTLEPSGINYTGLFPHDSVRIVCLSAGKMGFSCKCQRVGRVERSAQYIKIPGE